MADKSGAERSTSKVETPLEAYEDFMEVLDPLDTLMQGTRGMVAKSTTYLPQEEEEETSAYNNRLARTKLVNFFKQTVNKLGGAVFSKPVSLSEDMPEEMKKIMENVDNNGKDITRWGLGSFKDALHRGITHFLIDYPQVNLKTEGGVKYFEDKEEPDPEKRWKPWTKKNEEGKGLRPNWVPISADMLIGWRTEVVNGKVTLTQIRIKEQTEEPDGDYGQRTVNRIRVFTPKTWEIHVENEEGIYEADSSGSNNLGYIPLVSVYLGERVREMVVNPPLEGLADLNITHWQSTSDQRNILHYARLVIYFGKGIDTKNGKLVIGPNRFILADEPDADLKVIEHGGKAIESGRQDIIDIEKQMVMFGLTMMMPKSGNQTATERAIDSSENDSALKSYALNMEDGLNEAVKMTADYMQIDREKAGTVSLHTDFQSFLADVEAKILIEAKEKRVIPRRIVIDEFIRRGILKEDSDPIEIEAMLESEIENDQTYTGGFEEPRTPATTGGTKPVMEEE
ncbi:MAG: DUF4055 domain-containing protein [Planctomycetota bacterium]|jgi:hypothetical protein